jgi:hypothetical protein
MGVLDEAVEDGVGIGWVADDLVPFVDRDLAGQDGRAAAISNDEGRINEVDALVLTPAGLILVEIKSRLGTLQGDAHTWTWTTDGRQISDDNPLLLANREEACLQDAFGRGKVRIPWVEPTIFLSGVRAEPRLR